MARLIGWLVLRSRQMLCSHFWDNGKPLPMPHTVEQTCLRCGVKSFNYR